MTLAHGSRERHLRYDLEMPVPVLLLLGFFLVVSFAAAALAVAAVGPRRPTAVIVPALVTIAVLWALGHRSGFAVGPTVELFGFEVNLLFDLAVAQVTALITAIGQCMLLGRLSAGLRTRSGGDGRA
jgi:hypothetical protein